MIVFNNFESFKNTSYIDFFKSILQCMKNTILKALNNFRITRWEKIFSKIEENELVKIYIFNIKKFGCVGIA